MTDQRVNELREQLRALGYLDAGVDRFLLAPAGRGRGPVALTVQSSIRVGLLGGVLLGPSAAIGVGARLPGLITGVRDAIVIALYLGVLFFLAITVTSFLVTMTATVLARTRHANLATRATRIARTAGWVTSLACLLYLTLWWRNANAGFGWTAPVWTSFALVVAVTISLLLGHAQRITTLAVLASAGSFAIPPAMSGRSWRMIVAGGTLAFAGAALLLVLTAPAEAAHDSPPLTVIATGKRLRVIAIDGFDGSLAPQPAAGLLLATGGRQASIAEDELSDPARAWTTIATGAVPEVHGVHAVETRRVAGLAGIVSAGSSDITRLLQAATDVARLTRPGTASREERRVKTIWEVAAESGLRTAVVNWWATWPAPADNGIVITDRAVLRLEQGGPLDAEIAPSRLYESLRSQWPAIRTRARDRAQQAFAQAADEGTRQTLIRSAELDATVIGIFLALPGPPRDLDVIYLPGLDIAQHALLSGGTAAPSALAAKLEGLRRYYAFLDVELAPLFPQAEAGLMVMTIEQPGRVSSPVSGRLFLTQAAEAGNVPSAIKPVDIAPTIAFALGLPLSRELPGEPKRDLFPAAFSRELTARFVDSYGRPSETRGPRAGKPLDQEMIDRLRSLGYIK